MARRPFIWRKKNETKNQEAIDAFRLYNRLAPTSRHRYEVTIKEFGEFLLIHNKSLWDADYEDIKKYLLEAGNTSARSILSTFYRVLIDAGQFKGENPVVQLNKIEREQRKLDQERIQPLNRAESVLKELDDQHDTKQTRLVATERRKIGKRIMTLQDLDKLTQRTSHIRDRAILEFLYATGAQIQETINLNLADVDIEARQVTIHDSKSDRFRVLILPKRTLNFLRIYERWRRRQMSPSQAYFITKTTRRRMSDSSISTWLNRIQSDVPPEERWTAMDFRKRALLQHYWVTRDLTAVARFGGYKRAESALNLISEILADQGVDSIDKLATLPEFEQLKTDKQRVATVGSDDQFTITIQLDKEEMEIIRNSGLTPTQAVRTIISLKDLYGAFGGGGGAPAAKPAATSGPALNLKGAPSSGPNLKTTPSGGPNLKMAPSGGPKLNVAPSKGPNLSAAPSGGPNLKAAPALKATPSLKSAPTSPRPAARPPMAPPGGGPESQLSELKRVLARRRKMSQEQPEEKTETPSTPSLGGKIEDAPKKDEKKEDEEKDEEINLPELPDFNI